MTHGRAQTSEVRLGATRDGVITGLSMRVTQDAGAYPLFGAYLPEISRRMAVGPYVIPKVEYLWRSVVTNTTPVTAYRGAGRPEATYVVERIVETAARELGVDPAELRRKNLIQPADFPYETPVALVYDTGDYEASLNKAMELADYAGFAARKAEAAAGRAIPR